jgi:hypothetical protein
MAKISRIQVRAVVAINTEPQGGGPTTLSMALGWAETAKLRDMLYDNIGPVE